MTTSYPVLRFVDVDVDLDVDFDLDVDVDLDLDPLDDDLIPCAQVCHLHHFDFICVFSGNCRILLTCRLEFLLTPETSFR